MKTILLATALLVFQQTLSAQSVPELLGKIFEAQKNLKTISYKLYRQDTLVQGETRSIRGAAKILINPADDVFGFSYWGKRDDINRETIYDGNSLLEVNHENQSYKLTTKPVEFPYSIGQPGGQMINADLIKLDTSRVLRYELSQDSKYFYLTMHLPDILKYDVIKRYKKLTIDKVLMLPVVLKNHQVTLGKVQDLSYTLSDIKINDQQHAYNFSDERFPANYQPAIVSASTPSPLLSKPASLFELTSFSNELVKLKSLEGKVVLLDFWEVWCSPCVASMPKVDSLYNLYKNKGLEVYGIVNDLRQVQTSKLFMRKKQYGFPSLIGSETIKKNYHVDGIPYYVLINRQGVITFLSHGYTEKLEEEIKKLL